MTIEQKLERSKSTQKIDFTKINCENSDDLLVAVKPTDKIIVEPVWTIENDFEGVLYAEYIKTHPNYDAVFVRPEVLKRLERAANDLKNQHTLVVRAGHRPIEVQKKLLQAVLLEFKTQNPTTTEKEAWEHARMYVSDPELKMPPHCCGAAVDVDVFDTKTNQYVDFGSQMNTDSKISHLHSDDITDAQKQNRMMLLRAMLEAGFSSYYAEWWHFSFGDEIWAWFYGKDACPYGIVEL